MKVKCKVCGRVVEVESVGEWPITHYSGYIYCAYCKRPTRHEGVRKGWYQEE